MFIGFLSYLIILFFVTGLLILLTDVKAYKNANLKKEKKASLFLGWVNISMGFVLMTTLWVYRHFFW